MTPLLLGVGIAGIALMITGYCLNRYAVTFRIQPNRMTNKQCESMNWKKWIAETIATVCMAIGLMLMFILMTIASIFP